MHRINILAFEFLAREYSLSRMTKWKTDPEEYFMIKIRLMMFFLRI